MDMSLHFVCSRLYDWRRLYIKHNISASVSINIFLNNKLWHAYIPEFQNTLENTVLYQFCWKHNTLLKRNARDFIKTNVCAKVERIWVIKSRKYKKTAVIINFNNDSNNALNNNATTKQWQILTQRVTSSGNRVANKLAGTSELWLIGRIPRGN